MNYSFRQGAQYAILLLKWTNNFVYCLSSTADESVYAHLKKRRPDQYCIKRYKDEDLVYLCLIAVILEG